MSNPRLGLNLVVFATALTAALVGCTHSDGVGPPPTPELGDADDDLRESLADLRASVLALPEHGEMRGRLAMAYDINEFEQAAVATYEQAGMLDPQRFAWPYFRALLLAKMNDYPGALEAMDQAIAIDTAYVPTWMWRGEWLRELGRYDEANEAYLRAETLGAESVATPGRAQILLDQGQAGEAVELLEPMIDEDPHPHLYRMVGQAYRALGRQDDARIAMARGRQATPIRWYDPRVAERSDYIFGYSGRLRYAQDLIRSGSVPEALKVIDSIRTVRPEDPSFVGTLAWAYTEAGRVDEAVDILRAALEKHPDYYRFHRHLAQAYKKKGNRERLRHHLEQAVAANPTDAWAHEQLGLLATQEGRHDDALAAFDEAIKQGAENPVVVLHTSAMIEGARERWPEAIDRFERAVAIDESFTIGFIYLGRSLAEAGRFEEAREALAWAERLDTNPVELASARTRLRDLEKGLP
ncbi:MAG: tetratricopeptide repeat protein [Gammaproteobacteria bacterium]|nr:tetratricopeptide repeat protein [Gammaproteobacteria bacterium]